MINVNSLAFHSLLYKDQLSVQNEDDIHNHKIIDASSVVADG